MSSFSAAEEAGGEVDKKEAMPIIFCFAPGTRGF